MAEVKYKDLLDSGVHFGHLTRKWNPKMAQYIFMERNGIHIIDLNKTLACVEQASFAIKNIVKAGRKVMFVATKKQAKEVVSEEARKLKMPYVTERWLGGMLTNFATIRKSLKKMSSIEKLMKDESYQNLAKRERLMITREKAKLEKILGGISELTRLPAALFVVDVKKEHIAVEEAKKLNIPVFAIVDTNSDPSEIDYPIPGNDDAWKSVSILAKVISSSIEEGLEERKKDKENAKLSEEEEAKKAMDEGKTAAKEAPKAEAPANAKENKEAKPVAEKEEVKKPAAKTAAAKKPATKKATTTKKPAAKKEGAKGAKETKATKEPKAEKVEEPAK